MFVFFAVVGAAGVARAGVGINGTQMNGTQMNGTQMNGVQLNGTQMNGTQMNGMQLNGSWLSATVPCATGSCTIGATQMHGAQFTADTDAGPITLRLDSVREAPNDAEHDLWLYRFSWFSVQWVELPNGKMVLYKHWAPLCPSTDRDGLYNYAIPVAGYWNDCQGPGCGGKASPDGFTLACTDVGAIAKCVQRFGYKPWKSVPERYGNFSHWQSLEPFHEACVRMVRADYCGDGVSHTASGGITEIDAWDWAGVQTPTAGLNFDFEASWTPSGAYCVGGSRMPNNPGVPAAFANCPSLAPPMSGNTCALQDAHLMPIGPYYAGHTNWLRHGWIANTSSQTLIW